MRTITILFTASILLGGCAAKHEDQWMEYVRNRHQVDIKDVSNNALQGDEVYYYYLPDWEIYFYVPSSQWIYYDGSKWVYSNSAPSWFTPGPMVYKVDLNYTGQTPFMYHVQNRQKYPAHSKNTAGPRYSPGEQKVVVKNVSYSKGN